MNLVSMACEDDVIYSYPSPSNWRDGFAVCTWPWMMFFLLKIWANTRDAQMPLINVHADVPSKASEVKFGLSLHLYLRFMFARIKGPGKSVY